MDIKLARRAGYHNPCGFVTDILTIVYCYVFLTSPFLAYGASLVIGDLAWPTLAMGAKAKKCLM